MNIYKYPLKTIAQQRVMLPRGAHILTVQVQGGLIMLWAQVMPKRDLVPRTIAAYCTGDPLPPNPGRYLGTVQLPDVLHVYEEPTC